MIRGAHQIRIFYLTLSVCCYVGEESQKFWSRGVETLPKSQARRVEPRFESLNSNNSLVTGVIGGTVTLDCSIFMIQESVVSWAHHRGSDGIDLLTVGNTTFSVDPRYTVQFQNPTNWALRITNLNHGDAGRYICTLQTYPKQAISIYLEVHGPLLEIKNSSEGFVKHAGSHLELECHYRNNSRMTVTTATPYPFYTVPRNVQLDSGVLQWRHNNKTFSLRNRRRVRAFWNGESVVSILSIKSAILEDSGNYSCHLPQTSTFKTVLLSINLGEVPQAVYKSSEISSAPKCLNLFTKILHKIWLFFILIIL